MLLQFVAQRFLGVWGAAVAGALTNSSPGSTASSRRSRACSAARRSGSPAAASAGSTTTAVASARTADPARSFDVIVIGAGSAGLPLAIRAAERGARVLQLEADLRIGGTLHWSSGQISAAGTRLQKAQGIEDSPDEHYRDAQRIAHGKIDPVVLRLFVDHAAATIDWLMDLGFQPAPGPGRLS